MKIMVTGSRNFDKFDLIEKALTTWDNKNPTLIVGDCPTGADNIAKIVAERLGWPIKTFKADWLAYGRAAGPLRNADMVKAKPDICLGFVRDESRGTLNAMGLAKKAGIPVYRYEYGV